MSRTISFGTGASASVIETPPVADGDRLLQQLDLPPTNGTLILNGSTAPLKPGSEGLGDVLTNGVAEVAVADGVTVVTGATDAGIFSLIGAAMAAATAPLIGVAPLGLVTWPGGPSDGSGREALEDHHTHFVLVEGSEWGAETGTMLALAEALGRRAPSVAILCGGGSGAQAEVLGHARAGRPVVVLAGSGRLADDLAEALVGAGPAGNAELQEVVANGHLLVCPLDAGPDVLAGTLRRLLGEPS